MAVYVVGDVHGDTYYDKMKDPALMGLSKDDFVLVCGDFETVRDDEAERAFCIERYEQMPYSVLFVDGNHEEHSLIAQYPEEDWHGGRVNRISEHVRYLQRGYVFELDGMSFLAMGGAKTFAGLREAGLLEGPDAGIPSQEERDRALANLEKRAWRVDFIVSHAAPTSAIANLPQRGNTPTSEFTDWLEGLAQRVSFKAWLFGHYHADCEPAPGMRCLLNQIYCANDGALSREVIIEPRKKRGEGKGHHPRGNARKGRVALPERDSVLSRGDC